MKRIVILTLTVCLVGMSAMAQDETEKPWFDMPNCSFCKHILAEEGLMDNMTMEYHGLKNGMMSVTTVATDHQEAYDRCWNNMKAVGAEIDKSGKVPQVCGYCTAYGGFMMAGVQPEYIRTCGGDVAVWSSDNPELVTKMHEFATTFNSEMAKLEATPKVVETPEATEATEAPEASEGSKQ